MNKQFKKSHKLFHSFSIKPDIKFDTEEDEEVILLVRSHPITLLSWLFNGIIFVTILIIIDYIFFGSLTKAQFFMINFLAVMMLFSYFWFNFLSYFFNVGIVTNKRLIDYDYKSILYREINETRFSKVEDVTSRSSGYIASLFDYGDVFVQTAGTNANIELLRVPKPSEVEGIINSLVKS